MLPCTGCVGIKVTSLYIRVLDVQVYRSDIILFLPMTLSTASFNDKWKLPQSILYTSIVPHTHTYSYLFYFICLWSCTDLLKLNFYLSLGLSFFSLSLSVAHNIKLFTNHITFVFYWWGTCVIDCCCNGRSMSMCHCIALKSLKVIDSICLCTSDYGSSCSC